MPLPYNRINADSKTESISSTLHALLLALVLAFVPIAYALFQTDAIIILCVSSVLFTALYICIKHRIALRFSRNTIHCTLMFISFLPGWILNVAHYPKSTTLVPIARLLLVVSIVFLFERIRRQHPVLFQRGMQFTAISLTTFLTYVYLDPSVDYIWDRAAPLGLVPNWWGEVCVDLIFTSLFLRPYLRIAIYIFATIFMLWVQSRSALLTSIITVLAFEIQCIRGTTSSSEKQKLIFILGGAIITVLLILLLIYPSNVQLAVDLISSAFLLDDPHRGIGTGLSGRDLTWVVGLDVWKQAPLLGVGLDRANNIAVAELGLAIHSGFLIALADGGVLGEAALLLVLVLRLRQAYLSRSAINIAIGFGYMSVIALQPRLFNLNLMSLLFFIMFFSNDDRTSLNRPSVGRKVSRQNFPLQAPAAVQKRA